MGTSIKQRFASLKGISGSGDVLERYFERNPRGHLTLDPGDYMGATWPMTAPIGIDLWYLHNHVNLVVIEEDEQPRGGEYVDGPLSFLSEKMEGVRPLKAMLDLESLEGTVVDTSRWWEIRMEWENNGVYFVNHAAFEMALAGETWNFASEGPVEPEELAWNETLADKYAGYLTVPVGQLGVMQVISMFGQTDFEGEDFELKDDERPMHQEPPELFPPREHAGENWCFGRHLIQSGYVVPDDERSVVEIAAPHPEIYDNVRPKGWIRIWFRNRDVFPTPGEFVGILCKPPAVPPHVWWFQESSPFLYAGCWMETRHLTGGVVTEVVPELERTDGGIGDLYTVKVQGYEVKIETSDFYEYEVGERVGIIKKLWLLYSNSAPTTDPESEDRGYAFYDVDQLKITKENDGEKMDDLTIIPIAFYKENGNE